MEEDSDNNNTSINRQQNNKGEEDKERWVLWVFNFLLFGFCFIVGPFFLRFCQA
jgi:hypothetical protein